MISTTSWAAKCAFPVECTPCPDGRCHIRQVSHVICLIIRSRPPNLVSPTIIFTDFDVHAEKDKSFKGAAFGNCALSYEGLLGLCFPANRDGDEDFGRPVGLYNYRRGITLSGLADPTLVESRDYA